MNLYTHVSYFSFIVYHNLKVTTDVLLNVNNWKKLKILLCKSSNIINEMKLNI